MRDVEERMIMIVDQAEKPWLDRIPAAFMNFVNGSLANMSRCCTGSMNAPVSATVLHPALSIILK